VTTATTDTTVHLDPDDPAVAPAAARPANATGDSKIPVPVSPGEQAAARLAAKGAEEKARAAAWNAERLAQAAAQTHRLVNRPSLARSTVMDVLERWHNQVHRFAFDQCTEQPCRDVRDADPGRCESLHVDDF
jgi:hypothetical protein